MKRSQIEQALKQAVQAETPNVLERVLNSRGQSDWRATEMTQQTEYSAVPDGTPQNTPRRRRRWPVVTAAVAAACLLLFAGIGFGANYWYGVDAVIALDVNPSIELKTNRQEKVLSVEALNDDAKKVLDGMELAGTDLKVAMNALIGSMVRNGYIDEARNSVLVSVEGSSPEQEQRLKDELTAGISDALMQSAISPAILQQSVLNSESLKELASKYGISTGRAALIQRILALNPKLTADELATLNVNDLSLLLLAKEPESNMVASGQVSDSSYIGTEKAKEIALKLYPGAAVHKVEFDYENRCPVYEVELIQNSIEYEVEINALTGELYNPGQNNGSGTGNSGGTNGSGAGNGNGNAVGGGQGGNYIGLAEAKRIALAHAGLTMNQISLQKQEFDRDDSVYELKFSANGSQYEYDIHAVTGAIVSFEKEALDKSHASAPAAGITADQARQVVLSKLPGAQIHEFKLDEDDGRAIYEGNCVKDGIEYEFEVDASNGALLKWEQD